DTRPPAFEADPRHHAVLNGKDAEEHRIDDERFPGRSGRPHVHAAKDVPLPPEGLPVVPTESDRVEDGGQESGVTEKTIDPVNDSLDHVVCLHRSILLPRLAAILV